MLAVEFLAEQRYDYVIVQAPNNIEPRWRCEISIGTDMYSGYGDNGHIALCAAVKRFRETDPDSPGIETMTINADRNNSDLET